MQQGAGSHLPVLPALRCCRWSLALLPCCSVRWEGPHPAARRAAVGGAERAVQPPALVLTPEQKAMCLAVQPFEQLLLLLFLVLLLLLLLPLLLPFARPALLVLELNMLVRCRCPKHRCTAGTLIRPPAKQPPSGWTAHRHPSPSRAIWCSRPKERDWLLRAPLSDSLLSSTMVSI